MAKEETKIKSKKSFFKRTLIGALACGLIVTASVGTLAGCSGEDGKNGADGNTWKVEVGAPSATTEGKIGDMYLDKSTFNLYQKETSGWVLVGNVKGATGTVGQSGQDGTSVYLGYDGYLWSGAEKTTFKIEDVSLDKDVVENTIGIESTMSNYFEGSYVDLSASTIALMANYKKTAKLTQYGGSTVSKIKVVAETAGKLYIGTAKVSDVVSARTAGTAFTDNVEAYEVKSGLNEIELNLVVAEDETIVLGGNGSVSLYVAKNIPVRDEEGNFALIDGETHSEVIAETNGRQNTLAVQVTANFNVSSETAVFPEMLIWAPESSIFQ